MGPCAPGFLFLSAPPVLFFDCGAGTAAVRQGDDPMKRDEFLDHYESLQVSPNVD